MVSGVRPQTPRDSWGTNNNKVFEENHHPFPIVLVMVYIQ